MARTKSTQLRLKRTVAEILALPKCPPCKTVDEDKIGAVEYALYQYVNNGAKITDISKAVKANNAVATVTYWFKKFEVYEIKTKESRSFSDPKKRKNALFKKQCKQLYDEGFLTYTDIAKQLGCEATIVSEVAKEDGWCTNKPTRKFEWLVPKSLPENTIETYGKYKRTIYHFTKKIAKQYLSDEDKRKLATGKYDIDHILSVSEAFNRGNKPLPWQLICHPCNLQVLSRIDNLLKRHHSGHSPLELKQKIKKFEKERGKVKLPIEI